MTKKISKKCSCASNVKNGIGRFILWKKIALKCTFASVLLVVTNIAAAVNVNTDSAEVLAAELNGVGPKLAEAIIQYRNENGPFNSVQDLMGVKGIGPVIVDRNRDKLEFPNASE